jgi:alpha-mannosidase
MPGNVWVLALKRAERAQDGTILRLQERSGRPTQATLKSAALGLHQTVELAPWELKTLRIGHGGEVHEVSLLEV